MPKRTDIKKVMVIGSGPIVIGQAAEFDYAGTQACLALKEEGYQVILVNSNPATIMTDTHIADKVYMEPLTLEYVAKIIRYERPDAIVPGLGGQTGLNLAVQLAKKGILDECGVEILGTSFTSIEEAEDRELFKDLCVRIGEPVIPSRITNTIEEGVEAAKEIGYPVVLRPAFTLGGTGGGFADNEEEYERIEAELAQLAGSATEASDRSDVLEAEFRELVAKLEEEENQRRAEEAERARQAAIKEAERKRLEQEQARLRAIEDAARRQGFMWPLPQSCYHITYPFGTRLHPVYHTYKTHYGIDIAAPRNTSVYASKPGKVTAAQYHSSYGNYILIDHLDGTSTLYAHLNTGTLKVKKGDVVNQGDIIAGVGTTGVSTGYHLHFEVRVNGNSVNPMDYLPKFALPANLTIS